MSFGGVEISIDKQPLGDTVNSVVLFSFTELITVPVDRGQSDSAESWDFFESPGERGNLSGLDRDRFRELVGSEFIALLHVFPHTRLVTSYLLTPGDTGESKSTAVTIAEVFRFSKLYSVTHYL